MPINETLKEQLIKNLKEHGQSDELTDLCIKTLNLEHDSPDDLKSSTERNKIIKTIFDNIKDED
tara:strand:- start:362 stop:553 length:192 start_codon:yes stop_codon:yes gene_type:complete